MKMSTMKTFASLILCLGLFLSTTQAQELSKEEKKELKDRAKEFKKNPEMLKVLLDDYEELQEEIGDIRSENRQMAEKVRVAEAELQLKDDKLLSLESDVAALNTQLMQAQAELSERSRGVPENVDNTPQPNMMEGLVYKIQIGAFGKRNVDEGLMTTDNMDVETEAGLQKVLVGEFRDFEKAKTLQEELIAMGVKGAWVVAYQDGVRIPLKDALNGANM